MAMYTIQEAARRYTAPLALIHFMPLYQITADIRRRRCCVFSPGYHLPLNVNVKIFIKNAKWKWMYRRRR